MKLKFTLPIDIMFVCLFLFHISIQACALTRTLYTCMNAVKWILIQEESDLNSMKAR